MDKTTLWVLLPVLNEAQSVADRLDDLVRLQAGLPEPLRGRVRFCWIDSGSADGTFELLESQIAKLSGVQPSCFSLVRADLAEPSVGRALNVVIAGLKPEDFFLVHPVDCALTPEAWAALGDWFLSGAGEACAFEKRYSKSHVVLYAYAACLNFVLLRLLGWWVWTNLPCVRRGCLPPDGLETPGFLEDLMLARRLRANRVGRTVLGAQVVVSARRYERDGIGSRILLNGWITFLFVSGLSSVERLKKMYFKRG